MELVHFHRFPITSKCNTELITNTKNKTICYATTTFSLCSQFSFFGIYQWQNNVAEAQFLKEKNLSDYDRNCIDETSRGKCLFSKLCALVPFLEPRWGAIQ